MATVEPIHENMNMLGYTLKQRIGTGGFGEVWAAEAPGGLKKAIKIVYGYHDDKRAQSELKALDRAKELRHPFLLSLERIEVFQSQLIVVMELADKSLADLFSVHQQQGDPGIPRETLLKFIRGSADALDYLSEEHGLQHLDIKPENILIVSGHGKVADFGLIKQINDVTQSLMTGMTPAYAAPELFDGRPGKFSDQYSLAIVYQEMLTGQRPFPGTTPAQLAAQHVHGRPDLTALPPADQSIIAKALAKDPSLRFPNSRTLVEELSNIKRATRTTIRRMHPNERTRCDTDQRTIDFSNVNSTSFNTSDSMPLPSKKIRVLDPPECEGESAEVQPVLVVGVGASASRTVSLLKRQLIARHGSMQRLPAVQLVCIDTDRNEVTRLCMTEDDSALTIGETLAIPLMKPEFYREKADSRLTWLSRRWIFNIPRSLQTEGLRPLGRLAFAEHFESICEKLEAAIKAISKPEALATTSETLEINPGPINPRVIIVSSISGGVGSGITLDLAYTIRLLLAENGLETDGLVGLLLHSSYQRERDPGLAAANAFALLTELRHFVETGYPGDKTIGVPEFGKIPPFDFTYYHELGHDLSQTDFERQLGNIAEYIYLSSMSKCLSFFSACREIENELDQFSLRTFGLSVSGPENLASRTAAVQKIAETMVRRWAKSRSDVELDIHRTVESQFRLLRLEPEQIINQFTAESNALFQNLSQAVIRGAMATALKSATGNNERFVLYLDNVFGPIGEASQNRPPGPESEITAAMGEKVSAIASQLAQAVSKQILAHLNGPSIDLVTAKEVEKSWRTGLESMWSKTNQLGGQIRQDLDQTLATLNGMNKDLVQKNRHEQEKFETNVRQYCQQRLDELVNRFSRRFYRILINELSPVEGTIRQFEQSLDHLINRLKSKVGAADDSTMSGQSMMEDLFIQRIDRNVDTNIQRAEIQVFESLAKPKGGFVELFNQNSTVEKQLPAEILYATQRVLADTYQKTSLEEIVIEHNIGLEQIVKWISDQIKLASPLVKDCGGGSRTLVGLPAMTSQSIIQELLEQQLDIHSKAIKGTRGSFAFCFETEELSLANIAFRLLQSCPDAVELAKRLHSRNDIRWSSLNDLF